MNGTTISTLSRNEFNQLLESQEDTKKMITVEEVSPSTHAYQKGNYLIYNNNLYKVISAIAINDTLTISTIAIVDDSYSNDPSNGLFHFDVVIISSTNQGVGTCLMELSS